MALQGRVIALYLRHKALIMLFEFDQYLGFLAFLTILTIGFWLMIFLTAFVIPYWITGSAIERRKLAKQKKEEEANRDNDRTGSNNRVESLS